MEKRDFIDIISSKILSYSGIYVANSQIPAVSAFVEKKAAQCGTTPKEFCENLSSGSADFDELIVDILEFVFVGVEAGIIDFCRFFSGFAVSVLEEFAHLRHVVFLSAELEG